MPSARAIPETLAELNRLRAELTRAYYARVPDKDLARHTSAVRDAATRCAAAETRLARALGVSTAPLEPAKVAEALPPHSALIDLSRYIHVQTSWPSEVRYVAFVTLRRRSIPPGRDRTGWPDRPGRLRLARVDPIGFHSRRG